MKTAAATEWIRDRLWHVTTESDVEGRGTRDLGLHQGSLEDVALALADEAGWSLEFRPARPAATGARPSTSKRLTAWASKIPARTSVCVRLSIESGTWGMGINSRADYFRRMLAGRDIEVMPSNLYASVELARRSTSPSLSALMASVATTYLRDWRSFADGGVLVLEPPDGVVRVGDLTVVQPFAREALVVFRTNPHPGVYLALRPEAQAG